MLSILSWIRWSYNTLICSKSQGNNYSQRYDHRRKTKHLSLQFSAVAQSCPILCDPMDCSTLGLPVHHQLPEFTQTHVHWVGDTIQPSYPLSSPSLPAFNRPQHQGLFQWVISLHQVAISFSISPSNEYLGLISFRMDWLDLLAIQRTLKSSPIQQFKSINSLVLSFLYRPPLTSIHDQWKNHSFDKTELCWQSNVSTFFF